MARLNYVKSAQKSKNKRICGTCGTAIKPGDSYYWFANRIGRSSVRKDFCSKHRPRPSQMTTSDKLSQLYGAQEDIEDAMKRSDAEGNEIDFGVYKDNIQSALEEAAEVARNVGEEYRESKSNLPDALQDSSTGEELDNKADSCDAWADELEQAASEVESYEATPNPNDEPEGEEPDMDEHYDAVDAFANDVIGSLEL